MNLIYFGAQKERKNEGTEREESGKTRRRGDLSSEEERETREGAAFISFREDAS